MTKRPGPDPMPADVVELHGNRGKLSAEELEERRQAEKLYKPRPLRPRKPAGLSPYAADCWDMLVPELESMGLLAVIDAPGFLIACETWALWKYALEELLPKKADGTVDRRKKRPVLLERDGDHGGVMRKNQAFSLAMQSSREFRAWAIEFGLSPSARASLRPAVGKPRSGSGSAETSDDDFDFGT